MTQLADLRYTTRFQIWFPYFESYFRNLSTGVCNASLAEYLEHRLQFETTFCYRQIDCILGNMRESTKSHLASSSVILGLTPTVLSMLGLRVAEVSLLSASRPVLSFLLALGAPAMYPSRPFDYDNPVNCLQYQPGNTLVKNAKRKWVALITTIEYLLAICAVVNALQTSLDLGYRTVLTWKCGAYFMPTIWNLIPAVIHLIAAFPFSISNTAKALTGLQPLALGTENRHPLRTDERKLSFWQQELQLSARRPVRRISELPKPSKSSQISNILAGVLSFIHIFLGTLIFSSLLFISVVDTIPIILRYATSVLICRAILVFELAGMKESQQNELKSFKGQKFWNATSLEGNGPETRRQLRRHMTS